MKEELRKIISSLLSDEDPDVRRQAAGQLSQYNTLTVIAALAIGLKDDKKGVRDAAFRSLSTIGGEKVARVVVEYIGDEDMTTRNLVAELLKNIGDDAVSAVIPFLQDANPDVRKFAVDILGGIGSVDAVNSITSLLNDSDENVCLSAIEALGNIGDPQPVSDLLYIYKNDKLVQPAVAEAVGKIGDPGGARFLLAQLKEQLSQPSNDCLLEYTLIEALGKIGVENTLNYLYELLPKTAGTIQHIVIHAIVQISDRLQCDLRFSTGDVDKLLSILESTSEAMLYSGLRALSSMEGDAITKAIVKKLGCSEYIDEQIFSILMNRRQVVPLILELLEDNQASDEATIQLLKKLAERDVKRVFSGDTVVIDSDLLIRTFNVVARRWETACESTRSAIVDALFTLDGDTAALFLDKIIEDQDPWLRIHVIEILTAIADPRTPEFISRFLYDDVEMVREVADAALQSKG